MHLNFLIAIIFGDRFKSLSSASLRLLTLMVSQLPSEASWGTITLSNKILEKSFGSEYKSLFVEISNLQIFDEFGYLEKNEHIELDWKFKDLTIWPICYKNPHIALPTIKLPSLNQPQLRYLQVY